MTKGELTRQHIVVKAAPVFNRLGYAGCSMQDLMEATGLEKGGLYRHFNGKEELAVEAYRYSLEQVVKARRGASDDDGGAIARLREMIDLFVRVPSPIAGGCPLMNVAAAVENSSEAVLALAREGLGAWRAKIIAIVAAGIGSGEIRAEIDAGRMANAVISTLEGGLMISRLEGTNAAMLDAQATLEDVLRSLTR